MDSPGGSYYYSRPGMDLSGTLTVDGEPFEVTGWMDHQWGDFVLVDGSGWDWFAIEMDDGTA
ncbi:MAG: lipocalin-like domain-containing protein [Thermomicrobiales bacterium]